MYFQMAQVSCRVAAGLTDPRKEAEHKRFLPRRVDGKENGFLMLRCGEPRYITTLELLRFQQRGGGWVLWVPGPVLCGEQNCLWHDSL